MRIESDSVTEDPGYHDEEGTGFGGDIDGQPGVACNAFVCK